MQCFIDVFINSVFTLVLLKVIGTCVQKGVTPAIKEIATFILQVPGVSSLFHLFTKREIKAFVKKTFEEEAKAIRTGKVIPIPEKGISTDDLQAELLEAECGKESLSEKGRLFAYIYTKSGKEMELQTDAFTMFNESQCEGVDSLKEHWKTIKMYFQAFVHENALNPTVFPQLRKFENEIVAMTASMLHGDEETVGNVTSGGTESILMAMKTYRDRARKMNPDIKKPNIVAPVTIHPAFEKAGSYFDIEIKHVPVSQTTFTSDAKEYESYIDENTILLAGSAPAYPQAILDPIEKLSAIAKRRGIPFHVDACFGGFMLPWVEKIGHSVPLWDFRLPGVTSISADLHKYGFSMKGASVIVYRHESIRKYQYFAYSGWSGGLFASPTMAGTRPGGHLAASWVALRSMGQDGYMKMAHDLMETADKMKKGVNAIPGLTILGSPIMTAFGIGSTDEKVSIFAITDIMALKGWKLEVQSNPNSIHCSILPGHIISADQWLIDLGESVKELKEKGASPKNGVAAMYGMLAVVPNNKMVDDFLVDLFSDIYKP